METVLVTGGAGFIGSNLTEKLVDDGANVLVLDNFDPYYDLSLKRKNIAKCQEKSSDQVTVINGSTTDKTLISNVFDNHQIEVVYHQAAKAGVRPSVDNPVQYERNNVEGILNLLEESRKNDVQTFVHASSSSVYGIPHYLPYDEQHPNEPQSPYGITKLTSEHYCNLYNELYQLNTVNLRYFTVYGPRMRPNMAISNFVSRCVNGKPLVIYGDGKQTRDFTYIQDIVDANMRLLHQEGVGGETLNIGSSDNISIRELAEYVVSETDTDVDIIHEDARDGDSRHTHADISKAEQLIGYDPEYGIRQGVQEFINWYMDNQNWYEPLIATSS
ncbi:GDP-mannose 4,6-dehydratase [Halogeometricum luteum]|uniref:GDP-mannose 4,6-dehydratase n=1 Tax=Halogeometricum luteum TaxID=2950537 RepID=A0ABU2G3I8_9EURY|nr:GDP-mannose 4,6-dehydratase [Halogeometricum sp. S3BR5-2]MDS0295350.1 GDP-mannose 4,6-dehydratase [Halogeometricum sp. S3BR5-2]